MPISDATAELGALRVEPADDSAPSGPVPEIRIRQPKFEQALSAGEAARLEVRLALTNWDMAKDGDVDLSLDAFGPKSLKSFARPLSIGDLVPEDRELSAGEHVLFAVLVRPNGATVKGSQRAGDRVRFWIGGATKPRIDLESPMLLFSRPRGTYNGEHAAAQVLLDFYLYNVILAGGGPSVRATVRGPQNAEWIIDRWRPFFLMDLESGDYQVELELRDKAGASVPGLFGRATRVIVVNRDAPVGESP